MLLFPKLLYINPMVPAHLNPLDVLLMVPCSQYTKPNYTKPACSKLCTIIVVYQDVNTCALKKKKKKQIVLDTTRKFAYSVSHKDL